MFCYLFDGKTLQEKSEVLNSPTIILIPHPLLRDGAGRSFREKEGVEFFTLSDEGDPFLIVNELVILMIRLIKGSNPNHFGRNTKPAQ